MTTEEKLKKYRDWIFQCSAYQMALAVIGIDKQTVAPPAGASYRDERSAYLAGELFSLETDPEIVSLLGELKDDPEVGAEDQRAIALYYKNAMDSVLIPKEEFVAFQKLCDESFDAWIQAKSKADYRIFEPYLKRVIEGKKRLYGYRKSEKSIYNQMLDDFEPGMTEEKYDAFFRSLKERLIPLIRKVKEKKQIPSDFLHQNPKYDGMILSDGVSSGMHESQSRLCENYLGRSRAFWEYHYPRFQRHFPNELGNISLDEFYRAVNLSEPSFVRTEADELTYPLHIVIRYEIEKGLFNGTISTENLDQTWNAKYKEYLGLDVPNDRVGILQDVHWSDGSFGYFPTYALGTAFAAQFMHAMRKDLDVDSLLQNNRYDTIMQWLKEHVQHYGCLYDAGEIIKRATGEEFNVNYFLDYIEEKYTKLYAL